MNSRRNFLKQMYNTALVAIATPSLLSWATAAESGSIDISGIDIPGIDIPGIDIPGEDGMIVRSLRFVDLETPVEYFNTFLTPVPRFFVRNHMHEPSGVDLDTWRLTVGGKVKKPLTLSLAELSKLETHSVVNTLECAGN